MFTDEEAKEAPVLFKRLRLLYLTAKMPPWMRLKLGSALTPISKEQFALGDDPDARPVKAEDFDTSAWTKALARTAASTVRDTAPAAWSRRLGWCGDPRAGAEALV